MRIGGQITLDALSRHRSDSAQIRCPGRSRRKRGDAADPQCGHAGGQRVPAARGAGISAMDFPCFKAGGNTCFSITGENQFHAIFGGGPSFIVHPSDTAPALVALDAKFRIVGPTGERTTAGGGLLHSAQSRMPRAKTRWATMKCWPRSSFPKPRPGTRSTYHKVLDREAWTHAVVVAAVVLDMDKDVCRSARIVLGGVAPIPWRVPEAERLLTGQRVTPELTAKVADDRRGWRNPAGEERLQSAADA